MGDVREWLDSIGLGQYAEEFAAGAIDWEVLPELDHEVLKELGVRAPGHRLRILKAARSLAGDPPEPADVPPTASADPERRQLTVMFADLVGSTELSTQLDMEDLRHVNRLYQDTAKAEIERYGGYVARYMGDGVLAYFGYPTATEDAAERAVLAGLDLVAKVRALRTPKPNDEPLSARVGIATGPVVVGDLIGEGASRESAVVGETPNLAARLQGFARPDTVVVSDLTHRLVGGAVQWDPLGPVALKGFEPNQPAWRATAPGRLQRRFEALAGRTSSRLIGRRSELMLIQERWEQANQGEGQVVLISGEPGIGKSRLLDAFQCDLHADQHARVTYQCSPLHTNSALYPILRELAHAARLDELSDRGSRFARLSATLGGDPRTAALFAELLAEEVPDGLQSTLGAPRQRQQRIQAMVERLERLARDLPLLMLVEDLHWADPSTLEVLNALVDKLAELPVLALFTCRPEFESPWRARGHVTGLELNRFSRPQSEQLIREFLTSAPPTMVEQIYSRTDGVPLFIEEIAKALAERPGGGSPAVPVTLQDALLARLERLPRAKAIAQAASVIGRDFTYRLLSSVADDEAEVVQICLDDLETNGVVLRRDGATESTYSFKHALIRDIAYDSLLREKRRELHARIALSLEHQYHTIVETQPQVVAHHLRLAGQPKRSVSYWRRAGEQARRRSANQEAIAHLEAAMLDLQLLPMSDDREQEELRIQMLLGNAFLSAKGYGAVETGQAFERAHGLAERIGSPRERLAILWGLSANAVARSRFSRAQELLRSYMPLAEDEGTPVLRSVGHRVYSGTEFFLGNLESALEHARLSIELHPETFDDAVAARFGQDGRSTGLIWMGFAQWGLGYLDQASRSRADGLARAEQLGHGTTRQIALQMGGLALGYCLRDSTGVASAIAATEQLAGQGKYPDIAATARIFQGWVAALGGDGEQGAAMIQRGLERTSLRLLNSIYLFMLAESHLQGENLDSATVALSHCEEHIDDTGAVVWRPELLRLQAEVERRRGGLDAARRRLTQAIEASRRMRCLPLELAAVLSMARLDLEMGEQARALDPVREMRGRFVEGFDCPLLVEAAALLRESA